MKITQFISIPSFCILLSLGTRAVAAQPLLKATLKTENPFKIGKHNLRKFLESTPGTYGWEPIQGSLTYDFLSDGRLHIQGPDGEATMWEGRWMLVGDQLTIINTDQKKTKTITATIDGTELLLGEKRYRRSKS